MKKVYDGVATLDGNGQSLVQLPAWFEALNQDFRYQLTPIGSFAPVYIAQEMQNNTFLIAGDSSGLRVSWQVTGVRHDPWAEANRLLVEQPKPSDQVGTYLHPELYNQPIERGLDYQLVPITPIPSTTTGQLPAPSYIGWDLDLLPTNWFIKPPVPIPTSSIVPQYKEVRCPGK